MISFNQNVSDSERARVSGTISFEFACRYTLVQCVGDKWRIMIAFADGYESEFTQPTSSPSCQGGYKKNEQKED